MSTTSTLPTIMLIKRKNVAAGNQHIEPAKHGAVSQQPGDDIEDNSSEVNEQLRAHRPFLQGRTIEHYK